MRRFIATYRWELWLFFGIPVVTGVLQHAVWGFGECDTAICWRWLYVIPRAAGPVLLAGSYPFVRRQGREFLTLLWTLQLVTLSARIAADAVDVVQGVFPVGIEILAVPTLGGSWTYVTVSWVIGVAVLLWFARQASRIGTGYAFLLAALSFAASSFSVPQEFQYRPTALGGQAAAFFLTAKVGVNVLALWAMMRFDAGGPAFRWTIVAALLGAVLWRSFWAFPALFAPLQLGYESIGELFDFFGGFVMHLAASAMRFGLHSLLPFALVYLVCVRRPAPAGAPPLSPSEER